MRANIEDGEILTTLFDLNIVSCDRRVNNRGADTWGWGGGGVQPILTIEKYDLKFADHDCGNDKYDGDDGNDEKPV